MSSPAEQAERTTRRVLEEFKRSGALPGPFVRSVQAQHVRRTGHIPTYEETEKLLRPWVDKWLQEIDQGAAPEAAAQD